MREMNVLFCPLTRAPCSCNCAWSDSCGICKIPFALEGIEATLGDMLLALAPDPPESSRVEGQKEEIG